MLLAAEDYRLTRASLVPVAIVREQARWRSHVNGYVVMMNSAILDHPTATDLAEVLNRAAMLA